MGEGEYFLGFDFVILHPPLIFGYFIQWNLLFSFKIFSFIACSLKACLLEAFASDCVL